jgi:hypothetical protein
MLDLVTDGCLELRYVGETWRSTCIDRDHIHWDGDGGVWIRATASPPPPPIGREQEIRADLAAMPHTGERHPRLIAHAPCPHRWVEPMDVSWRQPLHGPQVDQPGVPHLSACAPYHSQGFVPSMGERQWSGCGSSPAIQPPPFSGSSIQVGASATGSSHLPILEAKVDYLTNAVTVLQGELGRMMQVRRAGAQRRAMVEMQDQWGPPNAAFVHPAPLAPAACDLRWNRPQGVHWPP